MSFLRLKTTECKVGVVGLYNSGKTVLLTSLINHLQDHDQDRFPLGSKATRLRKFTVVPPDTGWAAFNYTGHRDALVSAGKWPSKTTDRSQFACRFERSDWTFSDTLLKLYDLPGERIADAGMVGRDFTGWSEKVLALFVNDTGYRDCTTPFLDAIKRPGATAAELLHAYKLSLANLILNFKPLVSPSTFLLDVHGSAARPDTPENLAATRFSGADAENQFCPLPADLRTPGTELFDSFSFRYDRYVERVVEPTVMAFRSCTALVVLVDVTMLLAGGVGMYDDNRQIVRDLFDVLSPGENAVFGPVLRGLSKVLLPAPVAAGVDHAGRVRGAEDGPGSPRRPRPDADAVAADGRALRRRPRRAEVRLLQPVVGGLDAGDAARSRRPRAGRHAAPRGRRPQDRARGGAAVHGERTARRLADGVGSRGVLVPRGVPANAGPQGLPARPGERGPVGDVRDRVR
jgi:predicted YcjX-like family ATPase